VARWLEHLRHREVARRLASIEEHLRGNGLDAWIPYVRLVGPYLRFRGSWGDARRGNARMWREEAIWQAARRIVGALLGIKPRTLRLRLEELDHFGERIRAKQLEWERRALELGAGGTFVDHPHTSGHK